MIDLIKKIMFTGAGMASMTKDKIEELGKEIIATGKLTEKEGKEFIDELKKKSEESRKEMETKVDKLVKDRLSKMNIATRDDIKKLEDQLKEMAATLASLEKKE